MSDRKITPIRAPTVLAEVGGVVDESAATLAVYGEELEPEVVTKLLGVSPTSSFRKGYKPGPRSAGLGHGAWFLEFRGEAPNAPDVHLRNLLSHLPEDPEVWRQLRENFTVQIRIALHLEGWNKGFSLPSDLVQRVARIGIDMEWDIYAYGDTDA